MSGGWFATAEEALGLLHRPEVREVNHPVCVRRFAVGCDTCGDWCTARGSWDRASYWLPVWDTSQTAQRIADKHAANLSVVEPAHSEGVASVVSR